MPNNKILYIMTAIIFLLLGYILGSVFPFKTALPDNSQINNNQTGGQKNDDNQTVSVPSEKGLLEVTVNSFNNKPMVGIEVDVAVRPGQPEGWGVREADVNGKANFELDPGTYYVFFNMNRFPSGYVVPVEQKIEIQKGQTKKITIVLEKK